MQKTVNGNNMDSQETKVGLALKTKKTKNLPERTKSAGFLQVMA
jgi:hypothetical protein